MWMPELQGRTGPRYLAVADALADDVARGALAPGSRLPTHRELADRLGVTVGTVSRAYREARSRGLIVGEVGRGTFVRGDRGQRPSPSLSIPEPSQRGVVDLSLNYLRLDGMGPIVKRSLDDLCRTEGVASLLENYYPQAGSADHRAAGSRWLARSGLDVEPDRVLVCCGAQHAIAVALMGSVRPGDGMLFGRLTYPAVVALARSMNLDVHGVDMDEHGLLPQSLEDACRAHKARVLYTMPNVQNPTSRVMPLARRREIADVAERHGLIIIEDDVSGFLLDDPPASLVSMYRHRGFFVSSLSKSLAPGLRVGFVALPEGDRSRFVDALWATTVMAPPFMAELAARWIDDGTADILLEGRRNEALRRQAIVAEELVGVPYESHPGALQCWIPLPAPWTAAEFVRRAAARGVLVNTSDTFAVGREAEPAIRVVLGGARSHEELRAGLRILADLIGGALPARVV